MRHYTLTAKIVKNKAYQVSLPDIPSNTSKNQTYTLEFQTQRHSPINLSPVAIPSEI